MNDTVWWEPRTLAVNATISFLFLVIALVALVGNICVILAVNLYYRLRNEVANLFIVNLSVTDLCSASVVMISSVVAVSADRWVLGGAWCSLVCGANYCFLIVSMLTLCIISLDRYVAINHSLRYHTHITKRRVLMLIAYTWLQGLVFGLVPVLCRWVDYDYWEATCAIQWHRYGVPVVAYVIVAFLLCFLLPGVVLTIAYYKVFSMVKKIKPRPRPIIHMVSLDNVQPHREGNVLPRRGGSAEQQLPPGVKLGKSSKVGCCCLWTSQRFRTTFCRHRGNPQTPVSIESLGWQSAAVAAGRNDTAPSSDPRPSVKYSESSKVVRSLLIVVLAYFMCMTPFSVTKLYKVCVPRPDALPGYANMVATFFQYFSSAVNPLIYGLFRRDFQKAFLYLVWRVIQHMNTDVMSRSTVYSSN